MKFPFIDFGIDCGKSKFGGRSGNQEFEHLRIDVGSWIYVLEVQG